MLQSPEKKGATLAAQKTLGQVQAHSNCNNPRTANNPGECELNQFFDYVNNVVEQCRFEIKHFEAGRIKPFIQNWSANTSDESILNMGKGDHLQFATVPSQAFTPKYLSLPQLKRQQLSRIYNGFKKKVPLHNV